MPICIGLWQADRGLAASLVTCAFTAMLIGESLAFWAHSRVMSLIVGVLATCTRIAMNLFMWPHKEKLTVMQQTYWALMVSSSSSYLRKLVQCATYSIADYCSLLLTHSPCYECVHS
jgi:hypothetical protein